MATTVKELIEYLKELPLDTELMVLTAKEEGRYETVYRFEPLDLDPVAGNVEYTDMRGNKFVEKDSALWDRRFLEFGEK